METDKFLFEQQGKLDHANSVDVTKPLHFEGGVIYPHQLEKMRAKVRFSIWNDYESARSSGEEGELGGASAQPPLSETVDKGAR